jgi:hypothetical protein
LVGVPAWASWLIPVGIDLAAFSVTLDHSQSKRALDRLDAEDLEAEAVRSRKEARRTERGRDQGRASVEGSTRRPALAAIAGGTKVDQAAAWLTSHGIDTPTGEALAGLGWPGDDGDRKAVQRARRRLRDQRAEGAEAVS